MGRKQTEGNSNNNKAFTGRWQSGGARAAGSAWEAECSELSSFRCQCGGQVGCPREGQEKTMMGQRA